MTTTTQAWTPPTSVQAELSGWTPCECGCGTRCARRFLPGHDAKLKGALIRTVLRGTESESDAARERIARLGWSAHLAISEAAELRKREARRKPTPEPKAETPAPTVATPPATEAQAGTNGRVPASALRLSGKVGRKPRQS